MKKNTPDTVQQFQGRTPKGQFAKGSSGNKAGKPIGTRAKATLAAQTLLDGEAEALTHRAIELALEGDTVALRLCLERLLPPRKERALTPIELPPVSTAADLPKLTAAILNAVTSGQLTPGEGQSLSALATAHGKAVEMAELEQRIVVLEQKQNKGESK